MPTISVRLTRNEYKQLKEAVDGWNRNNPPSSMTAITKWLLVSWINRDDDLMKGVNDGKIKE